MKSSYRNAVNYSSLKKFVVSVFVLILFSSQLSAQWASTDFLVTDYFGRIAVYNQNLVFQRYLDSDFPKVTGLDLSSNGTLVAVGQTGRMKTYNSAGTVLLDITDANIGDPIDVKTSPFGLFHIGTMVSNLSVSEFSMAGIFNRHIGNKQYGGIAIVGNTLWAGGNRVPGIIDIFDIQSGALISTIVLDNGQINAASMRFSPTTNTVLMTDLGTDRIYERTATGTFVRQFDQVMGVFGATRGPGGDVYAVTGSPSQICRWQATGTLASCALINTTVTDAINIVWAGGLVPTAAQVKVSGRLIKNGSGVSNSIVRYTDQNGTINSARTNQFGYFTFEATAKNCVFTPQIITVNEDLTDLIFAAQE